MMNIEKRNNCYMLMKINKYIIALEYYTYFLFLKIKNYISKFYN